MSRLDGAAPRRKPIREVAGHTVAVTNPSGPPRAHPRRATDRFGSTPSQLGFIASHESVSNGPRVTSGSDLETRVEIICASRELFGADRSAVLLAEVLRTLKRSPVIVVPRARPERGLGHLAASRGIAYEEGDIAIASRRGIQGLAGLAPRSRSAPPGLTIVNSTAVFGSTRAVRRKVLIVREWLEPRSLRHRLLVARHERGVSDVVCGSSDVLQRWRAMSRRPARDHVVPNWLDQSEIDATTADRNSGPQRAGVLFLGRLNHWKGYDVLADAWEEAFSTAATRPMLTFVGAQPGTEFASAAEQLAARAAQWGWKVLPFDRTPGPHLTSAALVVVPSLHPEPFGLVILEAIAHGCRVIAFPGGGPSDMEPVLGHALQVIPRSKSSLAAALASWWENGGRAQSIDELALSDRILEMSYSPTAAVERWRAIL